jgi:hypothetical protein
MRVIFALAVACAAAGSAAGEGLREAVAQRVVPVASLAVDLPLPDTGLPANTLPISGLVGTLPIPDTGLPTPDTGIPALGTTRTTLDCRAPCRAVGLTCASGAFVTNGVCNCVNFFLSSCAAPGGFQLSISGLPTCPRTCASPPAVTNAKSPSPSGAASLGVSLAAAAAAAMLAL